MRARSLTIVMISSLMLPIIYLPLTQAIMLPQDVPFYHSEMHLRGFVLSVAQYIVPVIFYFVIKGALSDLVRTGRKNIDSSRSNVKTHDPTDLARAIVLGLSGGGIESSIYWFYWRVNWIQLGYFSSELVHVFHGMYVFGAGFVTGVTAFLAFSLFHAIFRLPRVNEIRLLSFDKAAGLSWIGKINVKGALFVAVFGTAAIAAAANPLIMGLPLSITLVAASMVTILASLFLPLWNLHKTVSVAKCYELQRLFDLLDYRRKRTGEEMSSLSELREIDIMIRYLEEVSTWAYPQGLTRKIGPVLLPMIVFVLQNARLLADFLLNYLR